MEKMIFQESKQIVTPNGEDPIKIFLEGTLEFVKKYSPNFYLANTLGFMDSNTELEYIQRFEVHNKIYIKGFRDNSCSWNLDKLEDFCKAYFKGNIFDGEDGRNPLRPRFCAHFFDKGSVDIWPKFLSSRANLLFTGYGNVEINPEENLEKIISCFKLK